MTTTQPTTVISTSLSLSSYGVTTTQPTTIGKYRRSSFPSCGKPLRIRMSRFANNSTVSSYGITTTAISTAVSTFVTSIPYTLTSTTVLVSTQMTTYVTSLVSTAPPTTIVSTYLSSYPYTTLLVSTAQVTVPTTIYSTILSSYPYTTTLVSTRDVTSTLPASTVTTLSSYGVTATSISISSYPFTVLSSYAVTTTAVETSTQLSIQITTAQGEFSSVPAGDWTQGVKSTFGSCRLGIVPPMINRPHMLRFHVLWRLIRSQEAQ